MKIKRARKHNLKKNTKRMKKFTQYRLKNEFKKFQIC